VTPAEDRAQQRNKAIDLHLASLSDKKVAELVGVSVAAAKRLIREGLNERVGDERLSDNVQTEIARIDAMISGMWAAARRGDVNAVDRVAKLQERRAKLVTPRENRHEMRKAYDKTVELSKEIKDVDVGAVELGRQYVDRIDEAVATCEGQELTKALYLGPHILGVFRELLATPAARAAADRGDEDNVGGKLAHLRSVARQQQQGKRGA
jgi:hypothetical protein